MRKRRQQLDWFTGAIGSMAKNQKSVEEQASAKSPDLAVNMEGVDTEDLTNVVDRTDFADVLDVADVAGSLDLAGLAVSKNIDDVTDRADKVAASPDLLEMLEADGLNDEDLDELPSSIAITETPLRSLIAKDSGLLTTDLNHSDPKTSDLKSIDFESTDHKSPDLTETHLGDTDLTDADLRSTDLRSTDLKFTDLRSTEGRSTDLKSTHRKSNDLKSPELGATDVEASVSADLLAHTADSEDGALTKAERRAQDRALVKERRRGADRRQLALTVAPGLVPTRSRRVGQGRVFDQESPGLSLPDRYENSETVAPLAVQALWHLPAPFDRVRLGLRARATLALALGSLVISVLVSTLTFLVARTSFVDAQRTAVLKVVNAHVEAVQAAVSKDSNVRLVLINQDAQAVLVKAGGERISNKLLLDDVPDSLRTLLGSTKTSAASQIVATPDGKRFFVGIKLPGLDGAKFFERAGLGDVEKKVNSLGRTLALVTALSTLGSALVGRSVARQVVRPLRNVANAAAEISSGRLDTRLQRSGDVDLDPLLASFNNMAATLQQRVEREGRFASDVSHELRTPLTALSTAAQLLQGRREEFSERSQRAVDVLVSQTQHFERLVLDLLEISRFDAGAAEIHREVLHLPEFVRLVVAINSPFVDGDGARVEIPVDDSEMIYPEVSLDKRRVERVVANLLQNAANYGGGAVAVSVADVTENEKPYVRIVVDDNGPGVPEAEKTAIFERFARGHATKGNVNSPKGTGLGLALVSAHVALHDGRVWVEDRENGGARFVALFAVEERVAPDSEDVA